MQVQIKGEAKELYVQTITLQPEEGGNLYAFHCINCGNYIQKIGGKVSKIYPLHEPSSQVPVISECRYCYTNYNFQTHTGYSTEEIKVVLHAIGGRKSDRFFCYQGKEQLLSYEGKNIKPWNEDSYKAPPFKIHCKNPDCSLVYSITDIF